MRIIKIPKRSGGTRSICIPSAYIKDKLRAEIPALQELVNSHCDMEVVHGFAEMRSPVTNAMKHIGFQYTLSFDLKDFFDHVHRPSNIRKHPLYGFSHCFYRGVAMQGLPTSPIIANIMASNMDKAILNIGAIDGLPRFVYTRYADDLTFSFDDPSLINTLKVRVTKAVVDNGFSINAKKTSLQCARSGRRIITGVAVGEKGIHPTRAAKRRLRAAIHNAKTNRVSQFPSRQWMRHVKASKHRGLMPIGKRAWLSRWLKQKARGLAEWIRLTPPLSGARSRDRIVDLDISPIEVMERLAKRNCPLTRPSND